MSDATTKALVVSVWSPGICVCTSKRGQLPPTHGRPYEPSLGDGADLFSSHPTGNATGPACRATNYRFTSRKPLVVGLP